MLLNKINQNFVFVRCIRTSAILKNTAPAVENVKNKLFEFMSVYEELIGLKEVKQAQQSVLDAERKFSEAQNERRSLNLQLIDTQQKLRNLRDEMDRLSRTDSKYLKLFTEEHSLLQNESKLVDEYKLKEAQERDLFFYLSTSLRDSQEKERARIERMKYLQLGLSILCTSLGIISAYLLNYFRNSSIKEILNYDKLEFTNLKTLILDLNKQQVEIDSSLNKKLQNLEHLNTNFLNEMKKQEPVFTMEMVQEKQKDQEEYLKLHPYIFSAMILLGFILYVNK